MSIFQYLQAMWKTCVHERLNNTECMKNTESQWFQMFPQILLIITNDILSDPSDTPNDPNLRNPSDSVITLGHWNRVIRRQKRFFLFFLLQITHIDVKGIFQIFPTTADSKTLFLNTCQKWLVANQEEDHSWTIHEISF